MKKPVNWTLIIHQTSSMVTTVAGFALSFDWGTVVSTLWVGRILLIAGLAKTVFNQLNTDAGP